MAAALLSATIDPSLCDGFSRKKGVGSSADG